MGWCKHRLACYLLSLQIRLYHLASGSTLLTKTIADGEALLTPTRLPGKSLFNQKLGEGPSAQIIVQGAYSQAQVLIADIVASSTVAIHVVDSILLPFQLPSMRPRVFPSLIDALVNTPELSSLHAASTALVTVEADDEGGSEMLAMLQTPSMNVTVFAPNNTAIQELIAELQLPEDAVLATGKFVYSNLVTPLLSQHMVKGRQLIANSITAGDSISMESMAGQELSSLRNVTGTFVLSAHGGARVVRQDDLAGLGVVHIIDGVLSERQ